MSKKLEYNDPLQKTCLFCGETFDRAEGLSDLVWHRKEHCCKSCSSNTLRTKYRQEERQSLVEIQEDIKNSRRTGRVIPAEEQIVVNRSPVHLYESSTFDLPIPPHIMEQVLHRKLRGSLLYSGYLR